MFSKKNICITLNKNRDILVGLLIFFAISFFFIIVFLRINGFTLESGDTAVAEQALWNTTQGDFFRQSFLDNQTNFVEHLNFIQFLYLPFYWVFPSIFTLYVLIGMVHAVVSFFLYKYAKEKIGFWSAIAALLFFLFNPIVVLTNIGAMHVVAVGAPLFLLSLIFYEKKKYYPWLIFILLTTFTTEFIAPTIFVFGLLAFLEKRSWKWFFPPIIASTAMYLASIIFIKIGFAENKSILKSFQFSEIAKNNFKGRLSTLEEFFRPALYAIPFCSKYSILFFPTILMTLFVVNKSRLSSGSHLFTFIPVILVFVMIDLIWRKPKLKKVILAVMTIGTIISLPIYLEKIKDTKPAKRSEEIKKAISIVKDEGSVTASRNISYHLSHRSELYLTDNRKFSDYIVLNTSFYDSKPKDSAYIKSVMESDEYLKVMDENDVVVLIKKNKFEELKKNKIID